MLRSFIFVVPKLLHLRSSRRHRNSGDGHEIRGVRSLFWHVRNTHGVIGNNTLRNGSSDATHDVQTMTVWNLKVSVSLLEKIVSKNELFLIGY